MPAVIKTTYTCHMNKELDLYPCFPNPSFHQFLLLSHFSHLLWQASPTLHRTSTHFSCISSITVMSSFSTLDQAVIIFLWTFFQVFFIVFHVCSWPPAPFLYVSHKYFIKSKMGPSIFPLEYPLLHLKLKPNSLLLATKSNETVSCL